MLKRKSCNDITALDSKEIKLCNRSTINIKNMNVTNMNVTNMNIIKNTKNTKPTEKKLQSYSEFIKLHPNASKSERIQAIQKFYNELF